MDSVELTVVDRETGVNSTRYRIVGRPNNIVYVQGVAAATRRHAGETKRRKRVSTVSVSDYKVMGIVIHQANVIDNNKQSTLCPKKRSPFYFQITLSKINR